MGSIKGGKADESLNTGPGTKFYGLTTPTPDSVFLDPLTHSPYHWFTLSDLCQVPQLIQREHRACLLPRRRLRSRWEGEMHAMKQPESNS